MATASMSAWKFGQEHPPPPPPPPRPPWGVAPRAAPLWAPWRGSGCLLLCLLVVLLVPAGALASTPPPYPKCLDSPEVSPKRHLYYNGKSLPIIIETSDRSSHQLVSHIFRILADERLGYNNTMVLHNERYNTLDTNSILNRLAGCNSNYNCFQTPDDVMEVPETMINLEVWNRAGFNMEPWVEDGQIMDNGPLGPVGKFGWFMTTDTVEQTWKHENHILDHWRALQTTDHGLGKFAGVDDLDLDGREMSYTYDARAEVTNSYNHYNTERDYTEEAYGTTNEDGGGLDEDERSGSYESEGAGMGSNEAYDDTYYYYTYPSRCTGDDCRVPVFRPTQCKKPLNENCAVLVTNYKDVDNGTLVKQVESLKLNVDVAWLGGELDAFVHERALKNQPTLFFNWVPNHLTAYQNFTRVTFPSCASSKAGAHQRPPMDCDYEVQQLSKLAWVRLERQAPYVQHLLQHLSFTQTEYEDLLRRYVEMHGGLGGTVHAANTERAYHDTACEWLKNNKDKWEGWLPQNLPTKTVINIAGLIPITGKFVREPGIVPGAQLAVRLVNTDESILKNYELKLFVHDTKCQPDIVLTYFLNYLVNITHPIVGILGPSCAETAEPIAGVAKHFHHVIISYNAEAVHLSKRAMFPYFFRVLPHITQNVQVYVKLFKQLQWSQVALLAEDGQEFPEYHSHLQDRFQANNIHVVFHRKMPRESPDYESRKYLEEIKQKRAKIIILTSFEVSGRTVFCEAYKLQMTAAQGYVWFLPGWYTNSWWDTDSINAQKLNPTVDCTTKEMLEAIHGHIVLSSAIFGPDNSSIVGGITVRKWRSLYTRILNYYQIPNSLYASYAYDAVWVFAKALDKLLTEDETRIESIHTAETTQRFVHYLNKTQFQGVTGPVEFKNQDRKGIIDITQQFGNKTRQIGQYWQDSNDSDQFDVDEKMIAEIYGGEVPEDGSRKFCAIEGFRALLGVDCDFAIVIANVMAVGLFGIGMVILLLVVKKRYDDKVRRTNQRMEELGLMADTSWLSLDQWEISRDHVVLNRKLGEGAFGTVYGGEALIEESWVAVAVKTLKVGSNPEEKLDFLSEAEMMKRFDDENIVKLLGVCTRGEPAYNIMEFMLHDNLKTFLLARRHLVGENSREAEDISSHNLTRMALDIAKGLHYLTSQHFVHRDLACRNCLVHATKTVKIGDFGMTRPMYDSDYYRFSRQGLLPVRWMAPESLSDGIFTPKSDIWSFGVLLYEVMTFGSFPYQGLGNKQVLNHVKNGNIITLPHNCPTDLQRVLRSCWTYNPDQRPEVEHLIDQFHLKPQLIQPVLAAPRSAMDPIEDNMDVDHLPQQRSKRTSSEHSHLKNLDASTQLMLPMSPTSNSITSETYLRGGSISIEPMPVPTPPGELLTSKNSSDKLCGLANDVFMGNSHNHHPPHHNHQNSHNHAPAGSGPPPYNPRRSLVIRSPSSSTSPSSASSQHPLQQLPSPTSHSAPIRTIPNPLSNPELLQFINNSSNSTSANAGGESSLRLTQNGGPPTCMLTNGSIPMQSLDSSRRREDADGQSAHPLWHHQQQESLA